MKELSEQDVINDESAVVVRLNGLLHTDDRLALLHIRKQLKVTEPEESKVFSSFQENLMYLLKKLRKNASEIDHGPCVVFILDEFHLFCEHKNQILLYNLFDIVQSTKVSHYAISLH